MARLPDNVERVGDGAGYRYRAYSKDGYALRLYNEGGVTPWALYDFRKGDRHLTPYGQYLGRRKTLTLIGLLAATITVHPEAK